MKKSKYVNQIFDNNWVCTDIFLAANYGHGTKHNAYRYQLGRITSDGKCNKYITVSGSTMRKIARNELSAEAISIRREVTKQHKNTITKNLYSFK